MSKVKKMFEKFSETFKNLISKFPITLIIVALTTVFYAIVYDQSFMKPNMIKEILTFNMIFAVESFFIEILFNKKISKVISYIVSVIISYGFIYLKFVNPKLFYKNDITRILIGYLFIIACISIYGIIKKQKIDFKEYLLKVFANIFNSSITYTILAIGIALVSTIFITLILNYDKSEIIVRMQILLLGLFYIPAILNSLWNVKDKEPNSFIKALVKYVLLPLIIISMIIIYLYIIKILVLRQMPSNVIFRILAAIFVFAFPVWIMSENFAKESIFIKKTTRILPYAYMPFLALEIYSLIERINQFGITPVRYLGIAFIVVQIITLVLNIIKKESLLSQILIYLAAVIFIAFMTPLNYNKVSLISQSMILKKIFPDNVSVDELSEKNKAKVSGAYKFLTVNNGKKYISDYVLENKELFEGSDIYYQEIDQDIKYIYYTSEKNLTIDIRQYSEMTEISYYLDSDFNRETKSKLEELIKNAVNSNDENEYIEQNKIVHLNEQSDLFINVISAKYSSIQDEIINLSVNGILLTK